MVLGLEKIKGVHFFRVTDLLINNPDSTSTCNLILEFFVCLFACFLVMVVSPSCTTTQPACECVLYYCLANFVLFCV